MLLIGMKNNLRKIIVLSILIINLFINHKIEASLLSFKTATNTYSIGEQFYVDVYLDTEGKIINGFEGSIKFSDEYISFIRAEEGMSMISLWVEKPKLNGDTITFSGIMPNGFGGVIDPFNIQKKLPGLMVRLIFQTKNDGSFKLSSLKSFTTLNDGLGTIENIIPSEISLQIKNLFNTVIYKTEDDTLPELSAYVTQDSNLYNNKYVVIFNANDKKTGIKQVLIKEGNRDWKEATSPYLLIDQTRHSIITLQAVNYSGSGVSINIEGLPNTKFLFKNVFIVGIIFIFVLFIIRKFYKVINFTKIYEKFK